MDRDEMRGDEGPEIVGERREGATSDEPIPPVVQRAVPPRNLPPEGDDRMRDNPSAIRAEDTEPYFGLQYIARLFKIAAMVVVVALVAEIVIGVALEGAGALVPLFAEVIQGVVLAAILWGAGDLTLLLIDVGHDVRAARVLLGRLSARNVLDAGGTEQGE